MIGKIPTAANIATPRYPTEMSTTVTPLEVRSPCRTTRVRTPREPSASILSRCLPKSTAVTTQAHGSVAISATASSVPVAAR